MFWPDKSPHFLACRRATRPTPERVAVGLSGGPDSLALLAALRAEGAAVTALCVDHQLNPDSAAVAERAAEQAALLGATPRILQVAVAKGKGMEAQARKARYEALEKASRDGGVLAVGHTRDDQAETLLLSALRGKAVGMPEWRNLGQVRLWRPLLAVSRADTVGACKELDISFWEDPLNNPHASRRVAIRQEIIPQLSRLIGGDAVAALAAAAAEQARDEQALGLWAEQVEELTSAPGAVRRRAIAAMLLQAGVEVKKAHLDAGEDLLCNWHGQGAVNVGNRLALVRKDGTLWLERAER
ncbi:tRNA lysidine(34) synthetase TilS [Corynebacterium pelargi]|uniref:tRNA(Ile)-lysidine synthase n=1 Tax=Corynebacterium pelargi TaxID=1471400 RepID=A0A410W718_9CORY|nr:tRNA lysidine(34) synthetase TilS [Corynebacterium pelargi]QAU51617.1 tRNA(Ile)-lysidine synthase [Corynebacterium pelargi]GGG80059.1 tRNA(Ile)-lysidine synthase [Corynebacterium pelargi]